MVQQASKKEKKKNLDALNRRYQQRISVAKQGKIAMEANDFLNAIKCYNTYFKIIADVKEVSDKRINPGLFSPDTELSEMMLISHIYWDLAKIYDRTPHLAKEFSRCLSQFSSFTIGHPYQIVNSEMLRRYIRSGKALNKKEFQDTYQRIYVNSKKCYIATHCFGPEHQYTNTIRAIKPILFKTYMGHAFVDSYYRLSPFLVGFLKKHPYIDVFFTKLFARPVLTLFSKIVNRFRN